MRSEISEREVPGTIVELWVYPLKGARGIPLVEALLEPAGLAWDRRWMVVREDGRFLTQREEPRLARIVTALEADHLRLEFERERILLPFDDRGAPITVGVWRDRVEAVAPDPAADRVLSAWLGRTVRVVRFPSRARRPCDPRYAPSDARTAFADGFPLLVTSRASLAELDSAIRAGGGDAVPMRRFRPNLVLDEVPARDEDRFSRLELGAGAALLLVKPCARCIVTTTDQETGLRLGPEPLATLRRIRSAAGEAVVFGQNAVPQLPVGPVRVRTGQRVTLAGARAAATACPLT